MSAIGTTYVVATGFNPLKNMPPFYECHRHDPY